MRPALRPPEEDSGTDVTIGRARLYSLAATAAMGLALTVLALGGRGGALPPALALAAALFLVGAIVVLTLATWRRLDELTRAVSREAGAGAFHLLAAVGGGWSILAHLGFAPGPAPLDWLTMFTAAMFAGSLIAVGRRGLL